MQKPLGHYISQTPKNASNQFTYTSSAPGACNATTTATPTATVPTALCASGDAGTVSSSGGVWAWACNGTGGNTTNARCSAPFQAQTISLEASPTSIAIDGTSIVSATSTSGLKPDLSSTTSATCSIAPYAGNPAGSTVQATGLTTGTCTVKANLAKSGDGCTSCYEAATEQSVDITITKKSQTIAFGAPPAGLVAGGDTGTVSATATSGLAVSFSDGMSAICSVSGSTVTPLAAGLCEIFANQAGDDTWSAAEQKLQNFLIGKGAQRISDFSANPSSLSFGDVTATLSATGGASKNPVVFSSLTPSVCAVNDNQVSPKGVGTCTVAADQAGNANYDAAPQVTLAITIGKASQRITDFIADPASLTVGESATLSATGGESKNAVVFSSLTPELCDVFENGVKALAGGTCTIAANQAGNDNYEAAPQVTLTVSISKISQSITGFAANPSSLVIGEVAELSAMSGKSDNPVVFSSLTPTLCEVVKGGVKALAAGTCTVAANQAGDAVFEAAEQVTTTIAISKISQRISEFTANPSVLNVGDLATLSAVGGPSKNPVTFSTVTPALCTVNGNTITAVAAGTCTLAADQAGDAAHDTAAQARLTLTIGKGAQKITGLRAAPTTLAVGDVGQLLGTGGNSGEPLRFSSLTPDVCSVTGVTVTAVAAGPCTVAADQAGDGNHEAAAQATLTITVDKAGQQITDFLAQPASIAVGQTSTLSATGGRSTRPVVFSSRTPDICAVSANVVTGLAAGACSVAANQAGDANYVEARQITLVLDVVKAAQQISDILVSPAELVVDAASSLSATGGPSGNPVVFSSLTPAVCAVSGNAVRAVVAGACTLAADQAGNDNYLVAPQVTRTIMVERGSQRISDFVADPMRIAVGGTASVRAVGGATGNPVIFRSLTPSVCSVIGNGNTVQGIRVGTCTVAGNQAGNSNYQPAAQATINLDVDQAPQQISGFVASPDRLNFGDSAALRASGGASGNPVTFSSLTPAVCSVDGDSIRALATGSCLVAASQAGNSDYLAAPQATIAVGIGKAGQQIAGLRSDPASIAVGASGVLAADAGPSSSAVTFSSLTPAVCSVAGNVVSAVGAGSCTVAANQASDANYEAAPQVSLTLMVGRGAQRIEGLVSSAPSLVAGDAVTLAATGGPSGNPVRFSSLSPGVCSVTGNTATAIAAGNCLVAANQAGNINFEDAPQATISIAVVRRAQTIRFDAAPSGLVVGGPSGVVSATATSGLPVSFTDAVSSICAVNDGVVTPLSAGRCTVFANQAGNAAFAPAEQVVQTFDIGRGSQRITGFSASLSPVAIDEAAVLVAVGGDSENPIVFTSATPDVCTVSGNAVTGREVGSCTVVANQAGNADYESAPAVSITIAVVSIEDPVPNGDGVGTGDGNGDGILDRVQDNVVSLPILPDDAFVTVVSLGGRAVSAVFGVAVPEDIPQTAALPLLGVGFTLTGLDIGATEKVEVYLPYNPDLNGLLKKNRITGAYEDIAESVMTLGEAKTVITFTLVDGGPFDADGVADGKIVDPAFPAILEKSALGRKGGGGSAGPSLLVLLLLLAGLRTWRRPIGFQRPG